MNYPLGPFVYSFFGDHMKAQRGLRPATVRSYGDALRLFLVFAAAAAHRRISRLSLGDLTFERVQGFLRHLEEDRGNHVRTRNQRLAALKAFFDYLATRVPEMLIVSERVAAIPTKRAAPAGTCFLERGEIDALFASIPSRGRFAQRDRALLLFLYNTGARAQEVADLRLGQLDLDSQPRVRLHGKGDKWRVCPLWPETAHQLRTLTRGQGSGDDPVFRSQSGLPLTRFGIYKIVRRHTAHLEQAKHGLDQGHISPHTFRHTTAMHLLESGVEVNVIRGWLGHVSLDTTNRYAEINVRAMEAAMNACDPPFQPSEGFPRQPVWRTDERLLDWLRSL